jgi:hypothetical protein
MELEPQSMEQSHKCFDNCRENHQGRGQAERMSLGTGKPFLAETKEIQIIWVDRDGKIRSIETAQSPGCSDRSMINLQLPDFIWTKKM